MITLEESLKVPLKQALQFIYEGTMKRSSYFGIPTYKVPLDAWVYQQILYDYQPDVIVEIGNKFGGSALMMAHWLDQIGKGRIIGVDLYQGKIFPLARSHPRITFIEGDCISVAPQVFEKIEKHEKVIVVEDSSHTWENTLECLRLYSPLVKPEGWYIVEDSIMNHGLNRSHPGPYKGIEEFLKENKEFESVRGMEQYVITWNPTGYLRRKNASTIQVSS